VNLAPADLPKEGGRFDLPIALGILAASGQLPLEACRDVEFLGELSLSGELKAVRGALPAAIKARAAGRSLLLPCDNADEAALASGVRVLGARHLLDVCAHLSGAQRLTPHVATLAEHAPQYDDLAEVRGQHQAKRALEIAAAGGHSLLFIGPPGTGKSMLASRLPGILPPMSEEEALQAATVASISDAGFQVARWRQRNFRAPHHTASRAWPWWAAALIRVPARFHSRITACCSWMSSTTGMCWKCCASRWRPARSWSRGPRARRNFRRVSS